jgi:hypothetical protein
MGFFDRRPGKPAGSTVTRQPVPGHHGGMTAYEAWAVVAPAAAGLDPAPRLTLITSGLDMSHEGRSRAWEFIFYLPTRNATAMLSLGPEEGAEDVDTAQSILTQRIGPAINAGRPAFPVRFRDSPEVVAEFSSRGVDFVAGPTDMKLEGRLAPSGRAVWVTWYWDREYTTPFAAGG